VQWLRSLAVRVHIPSQAPQMLNFGLSETILLHYLVSLPSLSSIAYCHGADIVMHLVFLPGRRQLFRNCPFKGLLYACSFGFCHTMLYPLTLDVLNIFPLLIYSTPGAQKFCALSVSRDPTLKNPLLPMCWCDVQSVSSVVSSLTPASPRPEAFKLLSISWMNKIWCCGLVCSLNFSLLHSLL
jgi:hypothetical protein